MDITTTKRLTPQEAQEALFHATTGDEVDEAVRQGGDVNRIDVERGHSPFHQACLWGYHGSDTLNAMIRNGADLEAPVPKVALTPEQEAAGEYEYGDEGGEWLTVKGQQGLRPLDLAIAHEQNENVGVLLSAGASVERTSDEKPVLNRAVERNGFFSTFGDECIMEKLLDHGANPNAPDPTSGGQTALHAAVTSYPAAQMMEMLIEENANLEAKDDQGRSPLVLAILKDRKDVAQWLIQSGARPTEALQHPSLDQHDWSTGHGSGWFLRARTEGNTWDTYIDRNIDTLQAVHGLAGGGDAHIKNLIKDAYDRGPDAYVSDAQIKLHRAETADEVEEGIRMGGDVNLVDRINGMSPFQTACRNNDIDYPVVEAMIKHGANLEAPVPIGLPYHPENESFHEYEREDVEGLRPLDLALDRGRTDTVKTLLNAGASIERGLDEVPLICRAHGDNVNMLLEAGADAAAINWHKTGEDLRIGDTPLHIAARNGNTANVKMLIDYGAPVNGKNTLGETPLVGAIRHDSADAVKVLLKRGADPALALNHPTISQTQVANWVSTDEDDDRVLGPATKALEIAHAADGRTNLHAERMIKQAHDLVDGARAERKQEQVVAKQEAKAERKRIRMGGL
ncbi:ankyrin repeat domain-containing protein [Paraburkholderia sp. C35]|uniref:ankyrin repeat domain-containing protein n=1 Tax=Paraburkholderia sp. C35 TaxID=2126993 RepID=UPI000D68724C|nr:ankyrin repeat domain-containing protein [Paraburkholderia sp. C35]